MQDHPHAIIRPISEFEPGADGALTGDSGGASGDDGGVQGDGGRANIALLCQPDPSHTSHALS